MNNEPGVNEYRIEYRKKDFVEVQESYFNARSAEMAKKSFQKAQDAEMDYIHISVWDRFMGKWNEANTSEVTNN